MIRVLHVVGGMNRGGAETWLMHVLRNIDRREFRMDFLVHTTQPGAYDEEIRALGSEVIPCLHPRRPWDYARNFRRILREHGPYDVVHSHVQHYSGYVLRLARRSGVPVRVAHCHLDTAALQATSAPARHAYLALMRRWIGHHATHGLACSTQAGASLFGASWGTDPRWRVVYCGIDLGPFRARPDRAAVRAELGISSDAFVVGHVGRFVEQKNHAFLLEVAAEVARREPGARLLLVGDGPLRRDVEARARRLNLDGRALFAGVRADVPRLLLGAMDVFLFPSVYEGLPLGLLEAQAAGLPCVCSDAVAPEAVAGPLVRRLSLSRPPEAWADAVMDARSLARRAEPLAGVAALERSPFAVARSVEALEELYRVR
jgi:glycosyltransferase involved in cell wall biosynthesis